MLAHATLAAFPELHPRGGQGDERLEKIGYPPPSAAGVPKPLPSLVCLPIIPAIEEVDAVQISLAVLPPVGVGPYPELRRESKAMPGPAAARMGVFAMHVGIGGQREIGGEARNASNHKRCTRSTGCSGSRRNVSGLNETPRCSTSALSSRRSLRYRDLFIIAGLEFYAPLYDVGAMVKGKPEASAAAGLRLSALCDVLGGIGGQPGAWIGPSAVVSQPPPCSQSWAMKWLSQQQER
jgi:hypothetical protein